MCVLVVDDTPSRRTVVCDLLQTIGADSVKQAASQSEALYELGAASVDAILLASCDAYKALELVAQVRSMGDHAYIPILLIVDDVDGPTASSSRDAGITDFIARPVTAAGICQGLCSVLTLDKRHRPNLAPGHPASPAGLS
ncbi:MAG: response regulator [Alphaproteobacteria bacterium]